MMRKAERSAWVTGVFGKESGGPGRDFSAVGGGDGLGIRVFCDGSGRVTGRKENLAGGRLGREGLRGGVAPAPAGSASRRVRR